ncbi:ku family dna [Moniliophthora roreri]|uniref:ATP-dependent DNA helicase II subunit 2 n=1 Tax=Moniliophthora roreri TaxID=221103 RepID=A0A0W0F9R6_MONRR|nr:ku family dna [Moniliophthora roreri]
MSAPTPASHPEPQPYSYLKMVERAGYTVTMFVIDVSKEMGNMRTVELPDGPNGEQRTAGITHLEWALQFVKLKIQEMIYNGRKTDQCGVIIFGSEETDNIINDGDGGYDNVCEYIPIGTPNAGTLAKLDQLIASDLYGDPLDAIIVGIETQQRYLEKKKWTRKLYVVTDGQGPIELEDWEMTVDKMNLYEIQTAIVGVDFDQDDDDYHFVEEDKTNEKRQNEKFYHQFCERLQHGNIGTLAFVLQEVARPDMKITRSTLSPTVLRLGDADNTPEEALEILVKTSKCTAVTRPKSFKKFSIRTEGKEGEESGTARMEVDDDGYVTYVQLKPRTEYFLARSDDGEEKDKDSDVSLADAFKQQKEENRDEEEEETKKDDGMTERIDKEQLIRGFKYGTSYAPCPDGQFPRLPTKKGIDICGFFLAENFKRELSMGEIQYVWGDPNNAQQQTALSSLAQAMAIDDTTNEDVKMEGEDQKKDKKRRPLMAIARWVTRDGMDPKMGVLAPTLFENVHCLLWAQMPFADDVRKYTFASLDHLVNKKGEVLTEHPYIPTKEQQRAMDNYVDAMDLMETGPKDEEGNRMPWFSTVDSYNPALHRVKQALFHCAIMNDLETNPISPPHPETTKYFETPKRVLKASKEALEICKGKFKVKHVVKEIKRARKDGHVHARDDDDDVLLLDRKPFSSKIRLNQSQSQIQLKEEPTSPNKGQATVKPTVNDSETEDEDEELLLPRPNAPELNKTNCQPLPTPTCSTSPPAKRPESKSSKSRSDEPDPDFDRGIAAGRIIGTTYPLADFKSNIKTGDVVSKAIEDLAAVIEEVVMKPFSSRRSKEMIDCMTALRSTALTEDEVDAWNGFLQRLHRKCVNSKPGNKDFWDAVKKVGVELSYITNKEAQKLGATSNKTKEDVEKLFN